jgi:PBSX family phage terminase large subunit
LVTSAKQDLSYVESTHRFNIWVGAVRSGKTYASIHAFIDFLKNGPPGDAMIIGVNRASIHRNVLKAMYAFLGFPCPSMMAPKAKLYGREIYFVGAPDVSAVSVIQGSTLMAAYCDECTNLPEPFFKMLETRLSIPGARMFVTANPAAPGHWLKKQYIDRQDIHDLVYWNFFLDDNPSLDEAYKKAITSSFTGVWYKRFILGEWCQASGSIYDAFDNDNIYTDPKTNAHYYIVGIDYGTTNATAAVLCAITPNQWPQMRVESAYYYDSAKVGRSKSDAELVKDIQDFIGYKNIRSIYIDPAAASFKIALRQADLPVLDAENDVMLGIKTVGKFIAGKNIVIQAGCKLLIEQLQSYAWDPKAADNGEDKPIKKEDHYCDALRYSTTPFMKSGEFSNPDEMLTIEQLRNKVYGENSVFDSFNAQVSGGTLMF